jgi:hypothetical protein
LGGGVNLHSGDVFLVQMNYDGMTLTLTITDATTPAHTFNYFLPDRYSCDGGRQHRICGLYGWHRWADSDTGNFELDLQRDVRVFTNTHAVHANRCSASHHLVQGDRYPDERI